MKRMIIPLFVIVFLMSSIPLTQIPDLSAAEMKYHPLPNQDGFISASASGSGTNQQAIQNITRKITDFTLNLSNTYLNTTNHTSAINLDSYQIPGWTLYRIDMEIDNLTATLEREVVGVSSTPTGSSEFQIDEHGTLAYYDELAQGFYNQSHSGLLANYSIYYDSPDYDTANQGFAYFVIRSTYSSAASNITEPVEVPYVGYTKTWNTTTAFVNLSASTQYYACIDGSSLIDLDPGDSVLGYPDIRWYYESITGDFVTRRHNTDGDSWGSDRPFEALLNYSYIPWDTSNNKALVFSTPEEVLIRGNGTDMTGSTYTFSNGGSNIDSIVFTSNQSLDIFYNITFMYSRTVTTNLDWEVQTSGGSVLWNATTTLEFPEVSGAVSKSMTLTKPSDWTATGMYNSTDLATDYGNYVDTGTLVVCSLMTNGTWILTSTAHNYITSIQSQPTTSIESVNEIIPSVVEDEFLNPADSGTANYTITYESSAVRSVLRPVSSGFATYTWNVNADASTNGTYVIEVFWSNGTEAGYLTKEIVVYYPTSLIAAETSIQAYTEDSFEIRVDFSETFGSTPLIGPGVTVELSYDSGLNVSLNDLTNGTWTLTIPTANNASGAHTVVVYAEGFAIENQTVTIDVILAHETLPLIYEWSATNENNISYLQNTNLTVWYRLSDGTNITDATLNITDGSTTWNLIWDSISEGYRIQLNGTDFSPVPNTYTFTARAWKLGFEYQENNSISLIVREETDVVLSVVLDPSSLTISYIGDLTVVANYSYDGLPILGASVSIAFNESAVQYLTYNSSDGLWYISIPAQDIDLGVWNISLQAIQNGYKTLSINEFLYIVEDQPNLVGSWPSDEATTDYDTPIGLNVTITDSNGAPIINSNVTVTLQGHEYNMTYLVSGIYTVTLVPDPVRGFHEVLVTFTEYGYETTSFSLNLTILTTTVFNLVYSPVYEYEMFEIRIAFLDSHNQSSIYWASVNLTMDGTTYNAVYDGSVFIVTFNATLNPNYHPATIFALADGCRPREQQISILVLEKTEVTLEITLRNIPIEGQSLGIEVLLTETVTGNAIRLKPIQFEIFVNFENGTVIHAEGDDSTNEIGVALWQYTIPSGGENRVESILIVAYTNWGENDDQYWDASTYYTTEVSLDALSQFLSLFLPGEIGFFVVLTLFIAAVAATGYNKRVKPKKRAARVALQHQLDIFRDLEAMQHFMAVYVDRGTCVFYHPFRNARIQADLISGFISAVTSVYGEIKGEDGVVGTLEEIHYQGLRLNSYSGEYVLGILILEKEISPIIRDRLQFFVEMFENEYESHLKGWTGIVDCFDPEWIVSNLLAAFGYSWIVPHTIDESVKMDGTEKRIIGYIKASMGEKLEREFSIGDYLKPIASMQNKSEAEILDIFLRMEDKGLIHPISIHSILLRQGLGLSGVDDLVEEFSKDSQIVDEIIPEEKSDVDESVIEEPDSTEIDEHIEEPKDEGETKKETEPTPESEDEVDPRDQFLADVETLLKKEKEGKDDENSE